MSNAFIVNERYVSRFWAKVDRGGDCWVWTAGKNEHGYGMFHYKGKTWKAHRFSVQLTLPYEMPELPLDHICHTPTCVRPEHLRFVTPGQNSQNRAGARKGSASGIRGVIWNKTANLWWAQVFHDGKRYSLGYYKDKHEAGEVARAKRIELFTHNDRDRI